MGFITLLKVVALVLVTLCPTHHPRHLLPSAALQAETRVQAVGRTQFVSIYSQKMA